MRAIEVKLYEFEELSAEAKEKAIEKNRTINVDFDWWDCTCESMKEVGVKIDSFDIYYRTISIIIEDSEHTASKTIENFGEGMEIVKISKQFIKDRDALIKRLGEGNDIAGYSVKEEFIDEYEFLQTDESVAETLICNDYEFTEDGAIY